MLKKIIFGLSGFLLGRKRVARLSRALLNYAMGDNNGNMETNGEISLLRNNIKTMCEKKECFIVFDIGANVGNWTVSLLSIMQKEGIVDKASVYCFEPSKSTYSELQSNLAKHSLSQKINLVNLGLGNAQESKNLHINKNCLGTNSLYKRHTESLGIAYQEKEEVKITTLDSFCEDNDIKKINFLKIDTEGYEFAVIQGAKNMLSSGAIDCIQFEYGGSWIDARNFLMDTYDFLNGFGYSIGKILPKGVEFYNKYDQRIETFQMANFLACRSHLAGNFRRIRPWML